MTEITEQLTKYLTDAHSIEEQALAQLRTAPEIAGDPELSAAYREHLRETEGHERLVRDLLEAHGAKPSRTKDVVMAVGIQERTAGVARVHGDVGLDRIRDPHAASALHRAAHAAHDAGRQRLREPERVPDRDYRLADPHVLGLGERDRRRKRRGSARTEDGDIG